MLVIMIRTVILYPLIILMIRLMGKKQLGELQPSELVTTILISNIATLSIEDPTVPMMLGVVPVLMIVSINVIMSVIMLKSPGFRCIVTGSPKVIISEGIIDRKQLAKLRYTIDDVLEAMREQGIFDITEVRYAIVETTGKINFYKKSDGANDPPEVVIRDGVRAADGVRRAGLTERELGELLRADGTRQGDVFLLTVSKDGGYELIRKSGGERQ